MKEKNVGKPWSKDEDELLLSAVAMHGEVDNWKNVALCVPGRTNKACRKVRNTQSNTPARDRKESYRDGCTLFHPASRNPPGRMKKTSSF